MSVSVRQSSAMLHRPSLADRLAAAQHWLVQAWQVASTRSALAELDDRALADLGLSRAQARFEAGRAFWDVHGFNR